ncbi:NAD(P)/FAD-dependent oxidoreductase [Kiloniella sp. b19]|uniref:NAD(P)/FAD-dependent oxidoreductase n=1 Tax=Kiloniella sp. GXU_MW_B19 TaxID=3141326 RepID=UPI0031D78CE9
MKNVSNLKPYDPTYDPLVDATPGHNTDYAPTYWIGTVGEFPDDDGPITADCETDVVVIGSGYTGLSCAIHLAKDHGAKPLVLEANNTAWGCSTRNGGQAQISAGRLKRSQWIKRWGVDVAKAMHQETLEAFDLFNDLIEDEDINCDPQPGGHYYIAHRQKMMSALTSETELFNKTFGYDVRMISREELHAEHVRDQEACGAMYEPHGTGIHAAKLAFGYQKMARRLGAKVHVNSPVLEWTQRDGKHYLRTPGGVVRANTVCVATGGYTSGELSTATKHRIIPVLSNSIATRVLTEEEREACGIKVTCPLTDTRTLRHYYRLLPCGRIQIGSRSAITGQGAPDAKYLDLLKQGLYRKFPVLEGIELDYSWWGWVDVSHDMMPRIFQPEKGQSVFYAIGYGGNGVMYSAQAGRHLANLAMGKDLGALPIFTSPLPHYGVLTPFRRLGQRMSYVWYYLKDEVI